MDLLPRLTIHMSLKSLLVLEPFHRITHIRVTIVLNQQDTKGAGFGAFNDLQALEEGFGELIAFTGDDGEFTKEDDLVGRAFGLAGGGEPAAEEVTEADTWGARIDALFLTSTKYLLAYEQGDN